MTGPYTISTCIHYRNSHSRCRADIDVSELADSDGRIPCLVIRGLTGERPCVKLAIQPPRAAETQGQMVTMLSAILAGCCPRCHEEVAGEMEFHGSILAMPCRHVLRSAT